MKTCFLFPGQGAQYPGMGRDLWESSPKVKDLFGLASKVTGMDLERLLFQGSEEELKSTDNTQVAVTLVNVAASLVLQDRGVEPEGLAGFSLGEYTALYEAGIISLEDLFPIVRKRGQLMEQAARGLDSSAGPAGMAAVIGLSSAEAKEVLRTLGEGREPPTVFLANLSSPVQVVLSGTAEGLEAAEKAFKEAGAKRFIRLKVSAPFHSPLLEEARLGLGEFLEKIPFSEPQKPVYANVTGKRIASAAEARQLCLRQVVSTVLWMEEEASLLADGFKRAVEAGPGTVLTGLWKACCKEVPCLSAGKLAEIDTLVSS